MRSSRNKKRNDLGKLLEGDYKKNNCSNTYIVPFKKNYCVIALKKKCSCTTYHITESFPGGKRKAIDRS